ncbi:MAG: GNAT family N-acetyltransferase [Promethearchaeota archaeon]
MKVSIVEWNEQDLDAAAQLIYSVFVTGNKDWGTSNSPETVKGYLEELEDAKSCFVIRAHLEDRLVGFAVLRIEKKTIEMNPTWLGGDPFISPDVKQEELLEDLIPEINEWAKDNDLETTIFYRGHDAQKTREYQRVALEQYQELGFYVREKDVFMMFQLADYEPMDLSLPQGYELVPIRDADYEAVYSCFYETFSHGQSPFFFDQSDAERRTYFETWSSPESIESDATIAVVRGNDVVAFSFARPYGMQGNYLVEWIGVHPDHRRRGLGKYLMMHVANVAKDGGYDTMSLSCATGNTRAYALYTKLGWYDDGGETIMALKLK